MTGLALGGCSAAAPTPPAVSPVTPATRVLDFGGDSESALCASLNGADAITVGEELTNIGDSPISIGEVSLVDPVGLDVVETFAIASDVGRVLSGKYPLDIDEATWDAREPAAGLTLAPGSSTNLSVAIALAEGRDSGTAKAIRISFTSDTRESTVANTTSYEIDRGVCA